MLCFLRVGLASSMSHNTLLGKAPPRLREVLAGAGKMNHGRGRFSTSRTVGRGRRWTFPARRLFSAGHTQNLVGLFRLWKCRALPCCETGVFIVGQVRASIPPTEKSRVFRLARSGRARNALNNQNPVGVSIAAGVAGAASMLAEPNLSISLLLAYS